MRTLVLGGYGAVGARIVAQLRANADVALAAGREAARADRVVDLREAGSDALRAALYDVEVVVNAAGLEDPTLAALITGHGVAFVDITASAGYVARSTTSGYIPVENLAADGRLSFPNGRYLFDANDLVQV